MKAIQLTHGSFDALQPVTLPDPEPAPGQVLVRIRSAGLNFIDVVVASGAYPGLSYPLIPLADAAAEVIAVGDADEPPEAEWSPGDRVLVHPKALWTAGEPSALTARAMRGVTLPGALREFAVVTAASLVSAPSHLDWAQASVLPISATTAWNALRAARVRTGSTVLVLGTGGTAMLALQLAKACGARVIVTSSSAERLQRALALGADHGIDTRERPQWEQAVLELTGGQGVDLVLETVGAETFEQSLRAVRQGGTVFAIGFLSGAELRLNLMAVIERRVRVIGCNTGSAADLREATAAIAGARLTPALDQVYPVDGLTQAYRRLAAGHGHFGKLAVRVELAG
ncbi:MAG: NAD(P)-dependent alcohol dehydrogenase [Burkholderiaceae bacterium]